MILYLFVFSLINEAHFVSRTELFMHKRELMKWYEVNMQFANFVTRSHLDISPGNSLKKEIRLLKCFKMDIYNASMKSVSKAEKGSIHAQITISLINLLVLTIVQCSSSVQQILPLNDNS